MYMGNWDQSKRTFPVNKAVRLFFFKLNKQISKQKQKKIQQVFFPMRQHLKNKDPEKLKEQEKTVLGK